MKVVAVCKICSTSFYYYDTSAHKGKYCSTKCKSVARVGTKGKPKPKGKDSHLYKRGWTIWKNGYKVLSNKGHRIYEHRYVVEKSIGRKLKPWEHVHHKNKNKLDNRIENLELLRASEHHRKHGIELDDKSCLTCGNEISKFRGDTYKYGPAQWEKRKFCSASCSRRYNL